jgi:fructosamine-3-kinase
VQILKNIFDDCGLSVQRYEHVHGGDINNAYCLYTSSGKYFLKTNEEKKFPYMFIKEANGLALLRDHSSFVIPSVIKTGTCYQQQYILLEWLEKGPLQKDTWKHFGNSLAIMHTKSQAYFGLDEENYIGSLTQSNSSHIQWSTFYAECRIMPLVKILFDSKAFSNQDLDNANSFCNKLVELFPGEPPALLHGDLWAGNYLISSSGYAAVFDPAVYFGHREMDIGMTKLFGGFDQQFYNFYNDTYPLEKGWEKRLPVSQLYPLLVHAVLFGGHYIGSVKNIFKAFS